MSKSGNSKSDAAAQLAAVCNALHPRESSASLDYTISVQAGSQLHITPARVLKWQLKPQDIVSLDVETASARSTSPTDNDSLSAYPVIVSLHERLRSPVVSLSQSPNAVFVAILFRHKFRISNLSSIKPISLSTERNFEVPIVDDRKFEGEQLDALVVKTIAAFPHARAILFRRYGLFTWGTTVREALATQDKINELFEIAVGLRQLDLPIDGNGPLSSGIHFKIAMTLVVLAVIALVIVPLGAWVLLIDTFQVHLPVWNRFKV